MSLRVPGRETGQISCYGLVDPTTSSGDTVTGRLIINKAGETKLNCMVTNLPQVDAVGEADLTLDYNYLEKESAGTLTVMHI